MFFGDRLPSEAVLDRMLGLAEKSEDLGKTGDALTMYKRIADHAPGWPKTRRALLSAARICEADQEYSEAIRLCNRLLARAPGSREASAAAHLSGRCGYRLAAKHDRDDSLCLKAIASLSRAGEEYPGEKGADETARMLEELSARRVGDQFEVAAFYDKVRRNPAAAIVSYREFARRFPGTPEALRALERADELARLTGEKAK